MSIALPLRLRVTLILAIALFFIIVLYLLKKRRLNLKYTLLWLLTGVVMLIFVIFPGIMQGIADLFGIQTVMNTLYLLLFGFVLILLMMLTSIVSKQTERIAELAQNNAFLEQRVRELEDAGHGTKELSQAIAEEKTPDGVVLTKMTGLSGEGVSQKTEKSSVEGVPQKTKRSSAEAASQKREKDSGKERGTEQKS